MEILFSRLLHSICHCLHDEIVIQLVLVSFLSYDLCVWLFSSFFSIIVHCEFLNFWFIVCFFNSLQEYGIRGFPTIKVFAPGKPPVDYQGARDVKPIAEFALQQVCWNLLRCFNIFAQKFIVKYFWHVWEMLHVGLWIE